MGDSPTASAHSIRRIETSDLDAVVRIHRAAFTESALSWLGAGAVRRYYDWQLTGPHNCIALGVWQDGDLIGFCFGGVFRGAVGGFVEKHRVYLALQVAARPWLALKPQVQKSLQMALARGLRLEPRSKAPAIKAPSTRGKASFGVLSIAVLPGCRSGGVGRRLMTAMEAIALEQGFRQMHLTVRPGNRGAVRFYERLGWVRQPVDDTWNGTMYRRLT